MGKYLDMWYGDSPRDADKIDIFFSDLDCIYRGNIYKNGRIIGDYFAKEAAQIENMHNPDDWGRIDCSQCQERNMCDQVQYDCPLDDPPLFPQSAEEVPPA